LFQMMNEPEVGGMRQEDYSKDWVMGRDGGLSRTQFLHSNGNWFCRCRGRNGCHPQEYQIRRTGKPVLHASNQLPMNSDARQFLSDLGRRISRSSGDDRETSFLFHRISVLLFRFILFCYMTALCWTTARSSSLVNPSIQHFIFLNFFLPSFLRGFK